MEKEQEQQVVIVTGLSGAGKTNAVDWFEDRGYYCIDNLPPALIRNFLELSAMSGDQIDRVAFVVDVRGGKFFEDLKDSILQLKVATQIDCKILFIEASSEALIRRFNETRRLHPLTNGPATRSVVELERDALREIRDMSDYIVDTTTMKPADLKLEIGRLFVGKEEGNIFSLNILSFGYKNGLPPEADLIFDVRFIPNPYYVKSLKKLTGRSKRVAAYVLRQPITAKYLQDLERMLEDIIPGYIREGKYHLNLAFGCTGGQHRSVAIASQVSQLMTRRGYRVVLSHRDN